MTLVRKGPTHPAFPSVKGPPLCSGGRPFFPACPAFARSSSHAVPTLASGTLRHSHAMALPRIPHASFSITAPPRVMAPTNPLDADYFVSSAPPYAMEHPGARTDCGAVLYAPPHAMAPRQEDAGAS